MSSKIAFVEAAVQPGVNFAALCREHGIARQTGYKYVRRFKAHGYAGLEEESRRPDATPLASAEDVVAAVLEARAKYPRWGATKLVSVLRTTLGPLTPSERTVHRILKRLGKVRSRKQRRALSVIDTAPTVLATRPHDVWTIDFKGWWRTSDGARCEPLTVRDAFSRYVLAVELLPRTTGECVRKVLERLFRRHGMPTAIQCDNGAPFISVQALGGLTRLSAWWVSLGIRIVRSRPGCPQDNGAHERMHRDMAADLQTDPAHSLAVQQRSCDRWRQVFNNVRPHAALGNRPPAELFAPVQKGNKPRKNSGSRKFGVSPPTYPLHWPKRAVGRNGNISIDGETAFISTALYGYVIALEAVGGLRHRVWLYDMPLGDIELATISTEQVERLAG